jgi:hypothetical protein
LSVVAVAVTGYVEAVVPSAVVAILGAAVIIANVKIDATANMSELLFLFLLLEDIMSPPSSTRIDKKFSNYS